MKDSVIPEAALSQHIAVLGKTGSGKTFAAKAAIVEPLLASGKRIGIVDPTSAWHGLRSSRDGTKPSFPILVLGGDHGDLPLPALGGAAVARLLAEQNVNLVADTSLLTVGERTRWFTDFAHAIYRANRAPLHLVLDEAHNFAPQGKVPDPDTGKMLHAANTLASGGRSRGIRLVMITQRPQKLHKDALTSADTLIAMRVLAPQDRAAVEDWIKGCGDLAQGKEVLNSLASLQRGEGWVWYPEAHHLARVKFPEIRTFDSSATPMDGRETPAPKRIADIDLTEIRAALADAVREAEANDPKLLRRRIAELEKTKSAPTIDPMTIKEAEARGYQRGRADANRQLLEAGDHLARIGQLAQQGRDHCALPAGAPVAATTPVIVKHNDQFAKKRQSESSRINGTPVIGEGGLRRMMIALAQRPQGLTKRQLGVRAGMSSTSGTFSTYCARMRTEGWMQDWRITPEGIAALGDYDPLPTGRDLLEYWLRELGDGGASRLLKAAADSYPRAITKAQAAAYAGLSETSGTFHTYLSKLRTLELIEGRGELKASDELFLA